MIDKIVASPEAALADVPDGATVMIRWLRQRRNAGRADRRSDRPGRARLDHRQQQRRQRGHRPRCAHQGEARAQDPVLLSAAGGLVALRRAIPLGRDRARARPAGHARRAHPRRRRGDRRLLHAHGLRHAARRGQGDAAHRRPRLCARVPDPRRLRVDQGRPRRPLGQPHLPQERAQLRADHGRRGEDPPWCRFARSSSWAASIRRRS